MAPTSNLLEQKEGWARIRTADDYLGRTPLAALRSGRAYATRRRVAEVQSLFAHLYRGTSVTQHVPLLTVPFETRLELTAEPPDTRSRLQFQACPTTARPGCRRATWPVTSTR